MKSLKSLTTITCAMLVGVTAIPANVAVAQDAVDSAIEEIVVTSRKRSENLQEVPDSVTVFNASAIERAGISTITNVAALTANLSAYGNFRPNLDTQTDRVKKTRYPKNHSSHRDIIQQDPLHFPPLIKNSFGTSRFWPTSYSTSHAVPRGNYITRRHTLRHCSFSPSHTGFPTKTSCLKWCSNLLPERSCLRPIRLKPPYSSIAKL